MKVRYKGREWRISTAAKQNSPYLAAICEDDCEIPELEHAAGKSLTVEDFAYFVDFLENRPYYLTLETLAFLASYFGCGDRAETRIKRMLLTLDFTQRLEFRLSCPHSAFMDDQLSIELLPIFIVDDQQVLPIDMKERIPSDLLYRIHKNAYPVLHQWLRERGKLLWHAEVEQTRGETDAEYEERLNAIPTQQRRDLEKQAQYQELTDLMERETKFSSRDLLGIKFFFESPQPENRSTESQSSKHFHTLYEQSYILLKRALHVRIHYYDDVIREALPQKKGEPLGDCMRRRSVYVQALPVGEKVQLRNRVILDQLYRLMEICFETFQGPKKKRKRIS